MEDISRGTRARGSEYIRARVGERDAMRVREQDGTFLFHRTRWDPCLSRRWGGRWLGAVRVRKRERETKNEDEVNDIHAGYRILPSRARPRLPSFRLSFVFFFFFFLSFSCALRYLLSPFSISHRYATISCIFYLYLVFYTDNIAPIFLKKRILQ